MSESLLPQPKRLEPTGSRFAPPGSGTIEIGDARLAPVAREAQRALPNHEIAGPAGAGPSLAVRLGSGLDDEGYRLHVEEAGITLEAGAVAGARHGVRTLEQLAADAADGDGTIDGCAIEDAPDLRDRGVYFDVTRGRVPQRGPLTAMAEGLGAYKLNQLQLYIEHAFRFQGHPRIGRHASPLTAEDILALGERCDGAGIELVPSLASFGHLATVLDDPAYAHLAEDRGENRYDDPDAAAAAAHRAWSLAPAREDTYAFLDSLYAEFLPLFSAGRFNVCCDEIVDLGLGQSHGLREQLGGGERGRGELFLRHVQRLRELAARHGKRIQLWGDQLRRHPDLIPRLPADATVLHWTYAADGDFDALARLTEAGLEAYGCPGTSSWKALFPRLPEARANIARFAAAARRHGAAGLLCTDWGGGGHAHFPKGSWPAFLFAAEQAWNGEADQASFLRRFGWRFVGVDDPRLADALETAGEVSHLRFGRYFQSIWFYAFFARPDDPVFRQEPDAAYFARDGALHHGPFTLDHAVGGEAAERLDEARRRLAAATAGASARALDPHGVLPFWHFALDTLHHAAEKLAAFGPGATPDPATRRRLREEMADLRDRFRHLWHARSRPADIERVLRWYDDAIAGLA